MMHVMIMGPLIADPVVRTGKSGKPYTTATLRVAGEGAEAFLASLIAFSPTASEALAAHRKGDTICAGGRASLRRWESKDGQTNHGLSIVCESVMSEFQFSTRRKAAREGEER
jgi:single-stranded DNA-binding protein